MPSTPSPTRIPCDTERLYHARRVLQSPEACPEDQACAAAVLRPSRDWGDRALVQQHRERTIAAARIRAEEQQRADTLIIPIIPKAQSIDLEERRAIRRLAITGCFLISALIASAIGSAATVTIAATTAQVEAWRALR